MSRIGIALLWLLWRFLPMPVLARLGEALGALLHALVKSRRKIVLTNLRLSFPELGEDERAQLAKAHFRAVGRASMLETISWWGSRADVEKTVRFEGLEHFNAHVGKPLILFSPHFVGLNLGGVRVSQLPATFASMYKPIRNPQLDRLMLHARTRFGQSELISNLDGIKPVIRAIRKGHPFYYLPDMDYGPRDAAFVPFFGVPAATITGMPRLARATGAAVVPCITRWMGDHYVTRFYPAWENYPTDDVIADTRFMNAFLEDRVREMPEQYFWLHRRFATRPEGEPDLYDRN
jgi:KDO2-lipid IV(A) lauroyltransferase